MTLNALIIDDEFLARKKVEKLLENFPAVNLLGEAKNGSEAVDLIQLKSPDLIFLDIEMPDFGGFEVIKRLDRKVDIPYVIFTTAYDQYAVRAFEVQAIDYLLKPLEADRFEAAIIRAQQQLSLKRSEETNTQILKMLHQIKDNDDQYRKSFQIKEKGRLITVSIEDIHLMTSNGNYIELLTYDQKYLYRGTMHALIGELNANEFLRVHRSFILNKRYIRTCQYLSNNEYKFILKNNTEVISGRGFKDEVIRFLENKNH